MLQARESGGGRRVENPWDQGYGGTDAQLLGMLGTDVLDEALNERGRVPES